jgi:hypothetical protein
MEKVDLNTEWYKHFRH